MVQIRLENVSYGPAGNLVEGLDLTISENDRIGVVGDNGIGKSTLLRCIAGQVEQNKGKIIRPRNCKYGFIEQDVPVEYQDKNMFDLICSALPEDERPYSAWKAEIALETFQAPDDVKGKAVKELSGGWQRLALIARTWMTEPDILLLDEPTNHLDIAKIMVLEKWLSEQVYGVPIVVISHDRHFLDSCTNKTLFIRGKHNKQYPKSFSEARGILEQDDRAAADRRDTELKELGRLDKSAHNLRQIGKNDHSDAAQVRARQIQKRADELRDNITSVHTEGPREIKLANSGTYAKRLIGIKNLNVNAPDGTPLFYIKALDIMQGDRLVIMGMNGSGKSQFLHHLHRSFNDLDRSKEAGIQISPTVELGYIDQHMSQLPLDKSLRDYFESNFPMDAQRTTSVLVNAGFPFAIQNTKIKDLSSGQRSRAALLALRLKEPNFYIMDEPTNHLDIAGQESLESELLHHGAACVLVSHDRAFVDHLGTKFYLIKGGRLCEISSPEEFYQSIADGSLAKAEAKKNSR